MSVETSEAKQTLAAFCKQNKITSAARRTADNPNMESDRKHLMDHWIVTLVYEPGIRKTMPVHFSMGMAHQGKEPRTEEVLSCLLSDASCAQEDFAEWCSNLGYDEDSRKAERTYFACRDIATKLEAFLGSELVAEANDCEPL